MEVRTIRSSVEVSSQRRLKGYAVRYNTRSHFISTDVKERIAKGAFARSLGSGSDCRFLYEHKSENLLGRTSSGTLSLRSDDDGLGFDLQLPNTQLGNDVYELCRRGDLRGMSFGFVVRDDSFAKEFDDFDDDDGSEDGSVIVRTVHDADLIEVSAVSEPCYESSSVMARGIQVDPRVEARAKEFAERNLSPEQIDMRNRIRLAVIKGSMNLQ